MPARPFRKERPQDICEKRACKIISEDPSTKKTVDDIRAGVENSALTIIIGQPQSGKTTACRQAFPQADFTHAAEAGNLLESDAKTAIIDEFQTIGYHIERHREFIKELLKTKKIIATALPSPKGNPENQHPRPYLQDKRTTILNKPYFPDRLVKKVAKIYFPDDPKKQEDLTYLLGGQLHALFNSAKFYDPSYKPDGSTRSGFSHFDGENITEHAAKSIAFLPGPWIKVLKELAEFEATRIGQSKTILKTSTPSA